MDFPLQHAQFSTFFISLVEANELQYSAGNESDFFDFARVLLRRRQKEKENIILKRLTEVKLNF